MLASVANEQRNDLASALPGKSGKHSTSYGFPFALKPTGIRPARRSKYVAKVWIPTPVPIIPTRIARLPLLSASYGPNLSNPSFGSTERPAPANTNRGSSMKNDSNAGVVWRISASMTAVSVRVFRPLSRDEFLGRLACFLAMGFLFIFRDDDIFCRL